jgi:hypothetical protein
VLCALLYTTSTRLRLIWVSRIWSLSSSIVVVQLQFSQSRGPRHWRRHCLCNWESVSCSDSKITTRSRILSSIIRIRCRSRKSLPESGLQGVDAVSHWTSANITWLDCETVNTAVTNIVEQSTCLILHQIFEGLYILTPIFMQGWDQNLVEVKRMELFLGRPWAENCFIQALFCHIRRRYQNESHLAIGALKLLIYRSLSNGPSLKIRIVVQVLTVIQSSVVKAVSTFCTTLFHVTLRIRE